MRVWGRFDLEWYNRHMRSTSLEKTQEIADSFVQEIQSEKEHATLFGLQGDLGSGKTTFVRSVARAFGIETAITSPTFVIEKIYKLDHPQFKHLIHIDAYRLESGKELKSIGWDDILADPHNLIFLEWPERVEGVLPEYIQTIKFMFIDETTRDIEYGS